jgi:hypothetical protein
MRYIISFNESQLTNQHNQNFKELANILQSEVLDNYDIYESESFTEKGDRFRNFTNEPAWLFHNPSGGFIYNMSIYPKNRHSEEGKEILKKISKDIENLKPMIIDFLGFEYEVEKHDTSLVIIINDTFYNSVV